MFTLSLEAIAIWLEGIASRKKDKRKGHLLQFRQTSWSTRCKAQMYVRKDRVTDALEVYRAAASARQLGQTHR